jgi:hypothetical protein
VFTGTTTQEVKGSGDEDKCDQDVEKLTVLDDPAVDIDHQEGKIRLVHDSRDEWVDNISNQRANNRCLRENWKETAGPSTTLRSGRDDKGG